MVFRKLVFMLALSQIAACSPLVERNALPSSIPVSVSIPAEIHPQYQERLIDCAAKQPEVALLINEDSNHQSPDLRFQLGESEDDFSGFAALLGWENIVVIANSQTNIDKISPADLAEFFTETPTRYEVWAFPRNHSIRELFDRVILKGSELTPYAQLVPNPDAMLEKISSEENAMGYLPDSWVTGNVTIVELDRQFQSSLRLPVLGITDLEPEGVVHSILVCLQEIGD
jgi:hypothetical protein